MVGVKRCQLGVLGLASGIGVSVSRARGARRRGGPGVGQNAQNATRASAFFVRAGARADYRAGLDFNAQAGASRVVNNSSCSVEQIG